MDVKIVVFKYEVIFITCVIDFLPKKKKKKLFLSPIIKLLINFQEIDLATETVCTIQGGSRKLLGKSSPVHAMQVHGGHLYAATSCLDGAAIKVPKYYKLI